MRDRNDVPIRCQLKFRLTSEQPVIYSILEGRDLRCAHAQQYVTCSWERLCA
jgi:hypothetical protein